MPVYIEKINGDVDQPTNRPTNRANIEQSAFSNVRKKAEICNLRSFDLLLHLYGLRLFLDIYEALVPFQKNTRKF